MKNGEESLITNYIYKAELVNSYFTTIGKKLSDNLNSTFDESDMSYISRVTPTCNEIIFSDQIFDDQLRNLNPRKVAGHDDIGSRELKVIWGTCQTSHTTIYCVSRTIEDVIEKLNVAANELHAWCTNNHLTVHMKNRSNDFIKRHFCRATTTCYVWR